jgi:hypothetical protein
MAILKKSQRPPKNQNTGPAVFIRNSPLPGLSGYISIYSEPAVINRKLATVIKSKAVRTLEAFGSERGKSLGKRFIE